MYRFVGKEEVIYGHFTEYLASTKALQEYARAKGCGDFTSYVPVVGVSNQAEWSADYASLAEFEIAMNTLFADEAFGALMREQGAHIVQGSAVSKILMTLD
jgi:hypothetical protein